MKYKKLFLGIGSVVVGASPIAAIVGCDSKEDDKVKFVKYDGGKIKAENTYFVTDGGSISDKSFNQSGYEGWKAASGQDDDGSHVLKPTEASKIQDSYNTIKGKNKDGKLIVAMGFNHATALKKFSEENSKIGFVFVDKRLDAYENDVKKQQGNIVSIVFRTEQAAFLEGIIAAQKAVEIDKQDPKIGYWGGMNIPTVNSFTKGLKAGVEYYNANNGETKDVKIVDAGFVGNFDPGEGKSSAEKLISEGSELILAVAGPQEFDALKAIKDQNKKGKVFVIGVDTDMSNQVDAADKSIVFDSIMKGLKIETEKAVKAILKNPNDSKYGFGKVVEATLDGDGVHIKDETLLEKVSNVKTKKKDDFIAAAKAFKLS